MTLSDIPHQARVDLEVMANKGVLHISQSSTIIGASPSLFCAISGTLAPEEVGSYPSAVVLSVYSIAPADWAENEKKKKKRNFLM